MEKRKTSQKHTEWLNNYNAQQNDWWGKCRLCGAKVQGTIAQIKEHKCDGIPAPSIRQSS